MVSVSASALAGTPYLIASDKASEARFTRVAERAEATHEQATRVQARIAAEAADVLRPYADAVRSELVAESNRIEGYDWTPGQVREVVSLHRELLAGPIGSFVTALRNDPRVYEALGLYRAHALADEWALSMQRPREFEIRALHELIASGEPYAGRYKEATNKIGGAKHSPPEPWDVPAAMRDLCEWWVSSTGDPALDATVVHAWLTHIHPFQDGNGRMARLLANLRLSQAGFPPLLIQAEADRGQYYDSLAASDDGDILPLYDLFVRVLRRTVRTMSSPDYVQDVIQDRLLTGTEARRRLWRPLAGQFADALMKAFVGRGWTTELQGYPDRASFGLLADRNVDGNGWFIKCLDKEGRSEWLLWFGYQTSELIDCLGQTTGYPSIFVSVRDPSSLAAHPYRPVSGDAGALPAEVHLIPVSTSPVVLRWGFDTQTSGVIEAAELLVRVLTRGD